MKAATVNKILAVFLSSIVILFSIHIITISNERTTVSAQATFKQLGLNLSNASDFLTGQAQAYVQYGEKNYYDAYMKEVNVTKTRENVVAELERLGAPQNEIALVQKAAELSNSLAELETRAFEAVERGDMDTARQFMFGSEYDQGKALIVSTMREFQTTLESRTQKAAESARKQSQIILIAFSFLLGTVIITAIYALRNTQKKMKLVAKLADCASKIASGDTDVIIDTKSHDEVGALAEAFREMVKGIQKQVGITERLADGNLTIESCMRSEKDAMGNALEKTIDSLNNMFGQINNATLHVSTNSKQLADSSQSLAQGATEQAATVDELSMTVNEVDSNAKDNAVLANKAAALADRIKGNAEKGSGQMEQMVVAVKEINEASQKIQKVIKVIDDIAFQTNILALNAAVEAARAGQYGKGFAVVADEVRNLAAKSADAAKDTDSLIVDAMGKAALGTNIAEETAISLGEIVSGIAESNQIVKTIAVASEKQSAAISEINKGINQVSQIVQQNSAIAEENAAASEEMSSQSDILQELLSRFKLKNSSKTVNQNPVLRSNSFQL